MVLAPIQRGCILKPMHPHYNRVFNTPRSVWHRHPDREDPFPREDRHIFAKKSCLKLELTLGNSTSWLFLIAFPKLCSGLHPWGAIKVLHQSSSYNVSWEKYSDWEVWWTQRKRKCEHLSSVCDEILHQHFPNFDGMDNFPSHWETYFLQQKHIFLSNSSYKQINFVSCNCRTVWQNTLLVAWHFAYLYYFHSIELNVSLGQRLPTKKVNQI